MSCFLEAAQVSRECFKYIKVFKILQDKLSLQEKEKQLVWGPRGGSDYLKDWGSRDQESLELMLELCLKEWVGLCQARNWERAFRAAEVIHRLENSLFTQRKLINLACLLHRKLGESWGRGQGRVGGNELENQIGSGKKDFTCPSLFAHCKSHYIAQGYSITAQSSWHLRFKIPHAWMALTSS